VNKWENGLTMLNRLGKEVDVFESYFNRSARHSLTNTEGNAEISYYKNWNSYRFSIGALLDREGKVRDHVNAVVSVTVRNCVPG